MAKARTLHPKLVIDAAKQRHQCKGNKKHSLKKGDKRFKVTEGRSSKHYCLECAAKSLANTIASLQALLDEVTLAQQAAAEAATEVPESSKPKRRKEKSFNV